MMKMLRIVHFERVNFMICEFYLNKKSAIELKKIVADVE